MKSVLGNILLLGSLCAVSINGYADWQCYVSDKGGHFWASTGSTQDRANAVALSFCTAYSPDSKSCHMSRCMEK